MEQANRSKSTVTIAGWAFALCMVAGCGTPKPVLRICTWNDYIDGGVVRQFEEQNGCRVEMKTFESNEEMYDKLKAGGSGYDIVTPSSYMIPLLEKEKLIQPLDHAKMPNVRKNFDRSFAEEILDPSFTYNAPYMVTYTGLVYRKDKLPKGLSADTWDVLDSSALGGRASLLDDMRETIGAALKSQGCSLNTARQEEIDKAVVVVLKWRKNAPVLDNAQYKESVASGEWLVGHGYSSDAIQMMLKDPNVGFALPKEGFTIAFDEMVIPADAPQPDLAHKFINFVYTPEVAKANIEGVCATMPVKGAIESLEPKLRRLVEVDADTFRRGEVLLNIDDSPAVRDMYLKAWERIKAGR
ncbi:MAG: spermidine/putrescine ABC transporter substrate-binding protein [Kiritimatiellae bacterium]|nr:spermidine/putrescine ABC transporter substrate-binding protein [Kiritimatiellia bacterium]